MTIRQFSIMTGQISEILKIENPTEDDEQSQSASGGAGFAAAQRMFPRGRNR